ncbi:MAG: carboxypeptidase regulatory-like domain-containing protein [Methanobrevibacter sp.]|uniref:Ig-like domain-containing protein n=1 Tax=Methanobrevibacter sp. TaxID=66852 RepID=UPI0025D610F3|nr:Ig-like domain-containing protein [Methanobrevibacter sp.]MBR3113743.1 carboxypeptidase regulatory-like domain-containing protein [Methanobrevibacter sp.]
MIGSVCAYENISDSVSQAPVDNAVETDYETEMNIHILKENETHNNNFTDEEIPSDNNGMNESNNLENDSMDNASENCSIILDAPKLIKLQYYPKNDDYYAKLCWVSHIGSTYEILRKDTEDFNVIATVNADSEEMIFYDKIGNDCSYTYSVREIPENNGSKIIYSLYDVEGLRLIASPNVSVDFQNLMANVTWSKIDNVTKYRIFRKLGRDGQFKCIAVVDANQNSYVDYYYNSAKELSSILNSKIFADASFNNLFYTVRACEIKSGGTSYGLYLKDGDFNLESPSIVSLNNNIIKWGHVPNADGYSVLKKNETNWEVIGHVNQRNKAVISMKLKDIDYDAYYSVQAYAIKNGEMVYSGFDEGFSLMNYSEDNSNYKILYFGDSITYGSPYKSASSRHIFSIPHRVAQLLGNVYYNPSIPGSTYHDLGQIDGQNILNSKYYRYRICRELVDPIFLGELPGNWEDLDNAKNSEGITNTTIDYYNIVVLSAGTNDYLDNSELGSEDSNDTKTFNGAFNHIMDRIETASRMRVDRGESPIKVVFVDLCYSDRSYNIKIRQNRDVIPNKIGLTLCDYQNALDSQYSKWQNSEYLELFNFKTRDYNIVNEDTCPYLSSDNLHYTKYAYGQYGNAFAKYLLEVVFKNKNSTLTASDIEMTYDDGSCWNVTLTDDDGNSISGVYVKMGVAGKVYNRQTNKNGTASLPINLCPGTYLINATFDGNYKYRSTFINATVTVNKAILTLKGEDLVMSYKDGSSYKINLTDCNGNPVADAKIKFIIANSCYIVKANSKGIANLPINLYLGNYTIQASIFDSKYESANVTNHITVNTDKINITANDVNMTYRDGTSYEVQLVDDEGKVIQLSGQIVKITIENKTYNIKTDDRGIAKLAINLSAGKYSITSKYNNNVIINNITVNAQ